MELLTTTDRFPLVEPRAHTNRRDEATGNDSFRGGLSLTAERGGVGGGKEKRNTHTVPPPPPPPPPSFPSSASFSIVCSGRDTIDKIYSEEEEKCQRSID